MSDQFLFMPPPGPTNEGSSRFGIWRSPAKGRKHDDPILVCVVFARDKSAARRTAARHGLGIGPRYYAQPMSDEAHARMWNRYYN